MSGNKKRETWAVIGSALALSLAASGCSKSKVTVSPELAYQHGEPSHNVTPAPAGSVTQASDLSMIVPYTLNSLMGTYTGTIQGWADNGQNAFSQSYTMTLSVTQVASQNSYYGGSMTAAQVSFSSNGSDGDSVPMSFSAWLVPGMTGQIANGRAVYSFVTQEVTIPRISQYPVALDIILAIGSDLKVDPTQSAIFIKDCKFSQGAECNVDLQNVWFLRDLGKR